VNINWRRFKIAIIIQTFAVSIGFIGWWIWRTIAYLGGPLDGDRYAQQWSFQLLVGAFYLGSLLVLNGVCIVLEAWVFRLAVQLRARIR